MRLMLKLSTVLDRPGTFSETGNRYVLSLFRSFVFHQTGEEGRPALEFGHVVESLAKLDVRSDEEIVLSTPDQKSLIIVTYADVARCLDIAFNEIAMGAALHSRVMHG
jgi:PAB-dependent poly(A)-specific ribonuclease subunit 3|tara:strand:+ start:227 stop:550 length:324 start_codon:yes stop_codon:yes gene_type:complete